MTHGSRFLDAFAARPRPAPGQLVRPRSGEDGNRVREVLAGRTVSELTVEDLREVLEGSLWALTPAAFRYYLPAFMDLVLTHYASVSVFASELVDALTEPSRDDVVASLDRLGGLPSGVAPVDPAAVDLVREQQLGWFDSGQPMALFRDRVDGLTPDEGSAVLAFLEVFREEHGQDFPFDELDVAIDRHWGTYRPDRG